MRFRKALKEEYQKGMVVQNNKITIIKLKFSLAQGILPKK